MNESHGNIVCLHFFFQGNTILHVATIMSSLSFSDFIQQDHKEANLDAIRNDVSSKTTI